MTNLSYKLCKELKGAGFPQEFSHPPKGFDVKEYEKAPYFPTLSELISECGERFITLMRTEKKDGFVVWFASSTSKEGEGDTPEIAVAKLWSKLNQ